MNNRQFKRGLTDSNIRTSYTTEDIRASYTTEEMVRSIVKESIRDVLQEGWRDALRGITNKVKTDVSNGVKNFAHSAMDKTKNMASKASQYYDDVKQAGRMESNKADARQAINVIMNLQRKGILGKNIANMVVGNLRKYGNN